MIMKYRYDLHIHSALSPCAENEMTPVTIVGNAALIGLDFVAIADHNATSHVPLAVRAGKEFGVKVVPAVEIQTSEDIHLLCLFRDCDSLETFAGRIPFSQRKNREELFGEQLFFDEDDNVVGKEERMLLDSADISCDEVYELALSLGGIAVPAHIDRDANSMLQILGDIPDRYRVVELSPQVDESERSFWTARKTVITDSDSHTLETMSDKGEIELDEYSVEALIEALRNA